MQYCNNELYHYGVLGMKWGKRKASYDQSRTDRRNARIGKRISKIEKNRKANEQQLSVNNLRYETMYTGKKLDRAKAVSKGDYQRSEVYNNYYIARQKAKKDKNYKNSTEYQKAKSAYGKTLTQELVWGYNGTRTIDMYKNMGDSEKKAKAKTAAVAAVGAIGSLAISAVYVSAMNKALG